MWLASALSLILTAAPQPELELDAPRQLGAVAAPAALPPGTVALYALVGAPDIGVGYRQGIAGIELEAKATFDVLQVSGLIEGGVKVPVYQRGRLTLAPGVALGAVLNSGSRAFDDANFGYFGLRPRISLNASASFSDIVEGIGQLEVPLVIPLGVNGVRFSPTVGCGAEVHVGERLSLLGTGHVGVDVIKGPLAVRQTRAAWAIRLGVGYRLF